MDNEGNNFDEDVELTQLRTPVAIPIILPPNASKKSVVSNDADQEEYPYEADEPKIKMGFYSEYKWVGPVVEICSWRDQNYQQLGWTQTHAI